jgi:hypothetical protein
MVPGRESRGRLIAFWVGLGKEAVSKNNTDYTE